MIFSAPNLLTGSSETLRETTPQQCYNFSFTDFKELLPQHKKTISDPFLEWFVGFAEGNGSFICTTNDRTLFTLTQRQITILHHIRSELGFGTVSHYKGQGRYIVADKKSLLRLCVLFNGNLILRKTQRRFRPWVEMANGGRKEQIAVREGLHPSTDLLSKTHWLSGFIDAEGRFYAQRIRDSRCSLGYRVRLRFFLDQRDEQQILEGVRDLLCGGSVAIRPEVRDGIEEKDSMWRLESWALKSHTILLRYLQAHPLLTTKAVEKKRWEKLYNAMQSRGKIPWQGKVLQRVENLLARLGEEKG